MQSIFSCMKIGRLLAKSGRARGNLRKAEKVGDLPLNWETWSPCSKENLQKLIDVVQGVCNRWRLRANVSKSAVTVFRRSTVKEDQCGESISFQISLYIYT